MDWLITFIEHAGIAGVLISVLAGIIPKKAIRAACKGIGMTITRLGRAKLGVGLYKPIRKYVQGSIMAAANGLSDGLGYMDSELVEADVVNAKKIIDTQEKLDKLKKEL